MAESSADIRREIDQQREALGERLSELETTVRETVDPRSYIERQPLAAAAVAFGVGFALANLAGAGSTGRRAPEQRELSETFQVTLDALRQIGQRELKNLVSSVTSGGSPRGNS